MNRQNVCANFKVTGCQELVTQRGNILCEKCRIVRKNITHNKREYEFDELMIKYKETDIELYNFKNDVEKLNEYIKQLEKDKCVLNERVNILIDEKNKKEFSDLNNSQIELDNEKLILDNTQLKILNQSLIEQNEVLTKQNLELSKKIESINIQNRNVPQTARNRSTTVSKIPELKKK
jgi:predicted nuclease with TOPRIM domain